VEVVNVIGAPYDINLCNRHTAIIDIVPYRPAAPIGFADEVAAHVVVVIDRPVGGDFFHPLTEGIVSIRGDEADALVYLIQTILGIIVIVIPAIIDDIPRRIFANGGAADTAQLVAPGLIRIGRCDPLDTGGQTIAIGIIGVVL